MTNHHQQTQQPQQWITKAKCSHRIRPMKKLIQLFGFSHLPAKRITEKVLNVLLWCKDWLIELRFYVPSDTKWVISETFFPANLLAKYWKTKTNTTKQTCICNKIYYNINLTPKTKVRFGRLLRPPASKRRGPILVSVFHKFVTYLRHLPTYLQHRDQQRACGARKIDDILGIEIVIAPAYSTNIR